MIAKRTLLDFEPAEVQKNTKQKHMQKPVLPDAQRAQRVHPLTFMPLMDASILTHNTQGKIRRQVEQPYTHFIRCHPCIVNGVEPINR